MRDPWRLALDASHPIAWTRRALASLRNPFAPLARIWKLDYALDRPILYAAGLRPSGANALVMNQQTAGEVSMVGGDLQVERRLPLALDG